MKAKAIQVRQAQARDTAALADVLVQSFHAATPPGSWFHSILRFGIYEDLRLRVGRGTENYTCWVAVAEPAPKPTGLAHPVISGLANWQTSIGPTSNGLPNTSQPNTSQPNTSQPNTSQPSTSQPNTSQPNTSQPNTSQPNTSQPGTGPAKKSGKAGMSGAIAGTIEMDIRYHFPWGIRDLSLLRFGQDCHYIYLSNLAVAGDWRRQGVATKLLQACERSARTRGFRRLYLHVMEDNGAARQLYHRAGYQFYQVDQPWWDQLLQKPRRLLLSKVLI
jgi:ribosomal protein S18 acetylase RimI-like enzyme